MRSVVPAFLAVVAASLILGFNPVATKLIYALPVGMGAWQFISARPAWCLVMYAIVAFIFRPRKSIDRADWWKFAVLGLCYGPGTGGLLPLGISMTSATHTVLLYALGPPLTATLGALVLRETLPWIKAAAMMIGVAGAVIVAVAGAHGNTSSFVGDLLVTGMVISTAVQTLVLRRVKGDYSAFFIASMYGLIGSVMLLAVTLPLGGARYITLPLHMDAIGQLLFFGEIVIGVSLLSQMFQSLALHTLKAGVVSAIVRYGALLTGTVTAVMVLRETTSLSEWIGGLLLASSVTLALIPSGRLQLPRAQLHRPHLHPDFHPLS